MLICRYSIDFLREYMRSCATLSIAHIISNIVRQSTDKTSVRIEQIKITSYNEVKIVFELRIGIETALFRNVISCFNG